MLEIGRRCIPGPQVASYSRNSATIWSIIEFVLPPKRKGSLCVGSVSRGSWPFSISSL
jgi:hypothetical protein